MSEEKPIRIVVADDHPAFRCGLRQILEADPDLAVVGEAEDGIQALRLVEELRPNVLLLDVFMPGLSGLDVLEKLASTNLPVVTVLVTAGIERKQLIQALRLSARGLILKTASPATYAKAIHRVYNGELWVERQVLTEWALANAQCANKFGLTRRELEIVREISQGSSNKQIAAKFGVSEPTIKSHLTNIFDKLGVNSRFELSALALQHHLLS